MSAMLMIGECGTSWDRRLFTASSKLRDPNHCRDDPEQHAHVRRRGPRGSVKRGSLGRSGCPSMAHMRSNRCWAGAVKTMKRPSRVWNAPPGQPGVLDAAPLAHHALAAVERRRVLQDAERRLVERGVDPLPFPRGVAVAQRRHHAEGGEEARSGSRDRPASAATAGDRRGRSDTTCRRRPRRWRRSPGPGAAGPSGRRP